MPQILQPKSTLVTALGWLAEKIWRQALLFA